MVPLRRQSDAVTQWRSDAVTQWRSDALHKFLARVTDSALMYANTLLYGSTFPLDCIIAYEFT